MNLELWNAGLAGDCSVRHDRSIGNRRVTSDLMTLALASFIAFEMHLFADFVKETCVSHTTPCLCLVNCFFVPPKTSAFVPLLLLIKEGRLKGAARCNSWLVLKSVSRACCDTRPLF